MPCIKEKDKTTSDDNQVRNIMCADSISSDINLGNEDQTEVEKPQEAITEPEIKNIEEFLIDNDLEDYQLVRNIVKNEIEPPARYDEAYFASIFSVKNFQIMNPILMKRL